MSRDGGDAVNQQAGGGGRAAHLNFQSYQRSQGGKYECRVAGPGNNTERVPVCIGECHAWGVGCGLLSIVALTALPCESSNTHGQGHTKSYMALSCQSR